MTFSRKDLPKCFVFEIKTRECTFYLVAESKEDMNMWVQNICHICGESTGMRPDTECLR